MVEAVHLGREAVGIEYEPRWADLARHNLGSAATQGARGEGEVLAGDARDVTRLLHRRYRGRVSLLLTSPPYGSTTHGRVSRSSDGRVTKIDHRYSGDRANLAHRPLPALLDGFTEILDACRPLLAPDAVAVVTARPYRRDGRLVDFPSAVIAAAAEAGFTLAERNVALLAGVRGDRLVPRASFFALHHLHDSRRARGHRHLLVHEDVLVFVTRSRLCWHLQCPCTPLQHQRSPPVPPVRCRSSSGQRFAPPWRRCRPSPMSRLMGCAR